MMDQPSRLADFREFVMLNRPHGELRANVGLPTPNGYRLEVACPCRVVFERWVFPDDAAIDMALLWAVESSRVTSTRGRGSS